MRQRPFEVGTGVIFPGPGTIGGTGTGSRPGATIPGPGTTGGSGTGFRPGAGATGGIAPETGGRMPARAEAFMIGSMLAFRGALTRNEMTAGSTIGAIPDPITTRRSEPTTVEFGLGWTTIRVPVGATIPGTATCGIEIVFSAGETSPGRADTARVFKDRNRAPRRSSVPMAVVLVM
jgi:hypothetical protein